MVRCLIEVASFREQGACSPPGRPALEGASQIARARDATKSLSGDTIASIEVDGARRGSGRLLALLVWPTLYRSLDNSPSQGFYVLAKGRAAGSRRMALGTEAL